MRVQAGEFKLTAYAMIKDYGPGMFLHKCGNEGTANLQQHVFFSPLQAFSAFLLRNGIIIIGISSIADTVSTVSTRMQHTVEQTHCSLNWSTLALLMLVKLHVTPIRKDASLCLPGTIPLGNAVDNFEDH